MSQQPVDILIVLDTTRNPDLAFRVAGETALFNRCGWRTGLLHVSTKRGGRVLPDIAAAVRAGQAAIVDPGTGANAKLMIVHVAHLVDRSLPELAHVRAERVLLVHHCDPKQEQMAYWHMFSIGAVSWVPTNRWTREGMHALGMPVPMENEDWRPVAEPLAAPFRPTAAREKAVIGHISPDGGDHWPAEVNRLRQTHRIGAHMRGLIVGTPDPTRRVALAEMGWTELDASDISVARMLAMIDVLLYRPDTPPPEIPDATISAALACGKTLILPPFLRGHVGEGALYPNDEDVSGLLEQIGAQVTNGSSLPDGVTRARCDARRQAPLYYPMAPQVDRVARLVSGMASADPPRVPKAERKRRRRKQALFVSSNGMGLGHLARSLAIARRMDDRIEPVFLSMSSAMSAIESFGFQAEYLPSQATTPIDLGAWDRWFRIDLADRLTRYDADLVVYDGNTPTAGLVDAALAHGTCSMCWVRRGMYASRTMAPHLHRSEFFDLIVEPGELAADRDAGLTATRRSEVVLTPPMRLLDSPDLLSRSDARSALGLDIDQPAVLIHLGAGANRNLPALVSEVLRHMRFIPEAQAVVVEWPSSPFALPPWPKVKFLTGMPVSRYYHAFDFSIGSAGYNTFHEVIAHALPTIFIPNVEPGMDDQSARAAFAQDVGAGFQVPETDLSLLPTVLQAMMAPPLRDKLRAGCRAMETENGAVRASELLAEMVL